MRFYRLSRRQWIIGAFYNAIGVSILVLSVMAGLQMLTYVILPTLVENEHYVEMLKNSGAISRHVHILASIFISAVVLLGSLIIGGRIADFLAPPEWVVVIRALEWKFRARLRARRIQKMRERLVTRVEISRL